MSPLCPKIVNFMTKGGKVGASMSYGHISSLTLIIISYGVILHLKGYWNSLNDLESCVRTEVLVRSYKNLLFKYHAWLL